MAKRKELQELLEQLKNEMPFIEYVEGYTKYREPCTFKCLKSGKLFQHQPRFIFMTKKCYCEDCRKEHAIIGHKICDEKRKKSKKQIQLDINVHNSSITYLEGYTNNKQKIKVKCDNCSFEWWCDSSYLFKNHINCPYCGDGISYPNKYFRSLMFQLDLDELVFEYSNKLFRPYLFDCYFVKDNKKYLVEIDGDFHYKETSFNTLNRNIKNDHIKNILAQVNDYQLIRISTPANEYNNLSTIIKSSELNQIFDLKKIDWEQCHIDACKNITKLIWDEYIYNPSLNSKYFSQKYHISRSSVNHYLAQGEQIGLFYYHRSMRPVF